MTNLPLEPGIDLPWQPTFENTKAIWAELMLIRKQVPPSPKSTPLQCSDCGKKFHSARAENYDEPLCGGCLAARGI